MVEFTLRKSWAGLNSDQCWYASMTHIRFVMWLLAKANCPNLHWWMTAVKVRIWLLSLNRSHMFSLMVCRGGFSYCPKKCTLKWLSATNCSQRADPIRRWWRVATTTTTTFSCRRIWTFSVSRHHKNFTLGCASRHGAGFHFPRMHCWDSLRDSSRLTAA